MGGFRVQELLLFRAHEYPVGNRPVFFPRIAEEDSLHSNAFIGWQALQRGTGVHHKAPHGVFRSEEHTSELQSLTNLVCRLLLEKKKRGGQSLRHLTHLVRKNAP